MYTKANFKKKSAEELMMTEFLVIHEDNTILDAITYFRKFGKNKPNLYYMYVIDRGGNLTGVASVRELFTSDDHLLVRDLMMKNVTSVPADLDQEEVARLFEEKDHLSMPVTSAGKLIGVINVDDILDVMKQEATEDFQKMATITPLDENLQTASVLTLYRKRIMWLIILVFMNIFSGAGIAFFEDTIESNIALVFFLPLLVDSGGNAGSQAATLMIRSIATGDTRLRDWFKLFTKEIFVAFLLGLTMALAVSSIGLFRGGPEIALVVSLTMVLIVMVGSLIGMSLPFIFSKFKLDPATASAPLITSICDIVGVLIYFSIATIFLGF